MGDNNPVNQANWYEFPSTRESIRFHEQFFPINKQLTTAGTAEDLWTVSQEIPTINLCTNPSFETSDPPTGFTASGSTLSRSNAQALYGTYSILVDPANSAAGEGFYYSFGGVGLNRNMSIAASVYVRGAAAAGDVRIRIYGVTSASWLATGDTTNLVADWTSRLTTSWTNFAIPENIRIYVVTATQHNNNFYCDGLQIELRNSVSTYCDGAQGLLYSWDGVAHASISRRRPPLHEVRQFTFYTDRDCYICYGNDRMVTASSSTGRLIRAGEAWWNDFPIQIRRNISFINKNTGERPTINGELHGV